MSGISISRQCELLGLARSSYYYEAASESQSNPGLMRFLDEQFTATPFLGSRRMVAWLWEYQKLTVNRKRIQRLMRIMRLEVIYPKPRLTLRDQHHKVFPYLLRGVIIDRVDQVWSTDITYM